ncbi:MAG: hypothetical protein KIT84_02510 [Labilithrix sp.]|nr:hypothetical protein [Labilithrix sp.]MCW5809858.1 hypothetical protein [Labilithrix sp.]
MVTKSIVLSSLLLLGACAYGVDDGSSAGEIASRETEPPTAKSSPLEETPTPGDPALRRDDVATTFVPLLTWGFESASADCNGWPLLGAASSIRAIPSRTGYYSCKVCADGSSSDLAVGRELGKVEKGDYTLSAFVRSRENTAAPSEALARVEAVDATGHVTVAVAPTIPVRGQWDRVTVRIDLPADAESVKIAIGSPNVLAQTCLFVDDVTFSRSP